VADTFEAAREAAFRIRIDYDVETPSAGSMPPARPPRKVKRKLPNAGDADKAFAEAAGSARCRLPDAPSITIRSSYHHHASWDNDT